MKLHFRVAKVYNDLLSWFGASKVVDKRGNPLVVHHGTPDTRRLLETKTFKTKREHLLGVKDSERVFFFTSDPSVAKTYADPRRAFDYQNSDPGVLSFYLKLLNPFIIDWRGQSWRGNEDCIAKARKTGHDGVIIKNVIDNYSNFDITKRSKSTDVYIAFRPDQIKSTKNIKFSDSELFEEN